MRFKVNTRNLFLCLYFKIENRLASYSYWQFQIEGVFFVFESKKGKCYKMFVLKLVSETLNLNNLVRVIKVLNSAQALDVKNVLTFIHIFHLRYWKVERCRWKKYSGTPCIYKYLLVFISSQFFFWKIQMILEVCW